MDSEAHHVYFKKFLEHQRADRPWNFYLEIEDLDKITDHIRRQKKISGIIQTYFRKRGISVWFVSVKICFDFVFKFLICTGLQPSDVGGCGR